MNPPKSIKSSISITGKAKLIFFCFLFFNPWAAHAQAPTEKPTAALKQKASTLDKLTPQQRAEVAKLMQDAYLLGVQDGKKASAAPKATQQKSVAAFSSIESQIDGEFEGWDGETIIKLMNGQIWRQSEYYYEYNYSYMPEVLIYRSGAAYKMKVKGMDKAVEVELIR